MIRDLLAGLILISFFGLIIWGAHHEAPTTIPVIKPIEHNIVTHELVCVTVKNDYCFRYEVRRIIKE